MRNMFLILVLATGLGQQTQPDPPTFPTFEPFVASRMFRMFGDPRSADLEKLSKQLSVMAQASEAGREAGEEYSPPKTSTLSALLEPEIADDQRIVAPLVPLALMKLEPLWTASSWTGEQVASARAAAGIIGRIAGAPRPSFGEGKDAENRAGLEELVRWYRTKMARAEWYAAMIFTLDDGPYAGLPYGASGLLDAKAVQRLDDKRELRLCLVERANEPWVLQAVSEGKPLWSRVISAAPDESVAEVSFLPEDPVQRLGPYGWKLRLLVSWSGGKELSEVFLDSDANLLFYFLSW